VCAAFAASGGAAVAVDGEMIDVPVVERARAVLRSAGLAS
jgi:citrate lyase subunit beta/citryl-CoA lyase